MHESHLSTRSPAHSHSAVSRILAGSFLSHVPFGPRDVTARMQSGRSIPSSVGVLIADRFVQSFLLLFVFSIS